MAGKKLFVIDFGFYSVPGETECREMIWSEGKACSSDCPLTACYRHGFTVAQVDADNARLVRLKRAELRAAK